MDNVLYTLILLHIVFYISHVKEKKIANHLLKLQFDALMLQCFNECIMLLMIQFGFERGIVQMPPYEPLNAYIVEVFNSFF